MSRISCVRSTTRAVRAFSSAFCCAGASSSSTISTSAFARSYACLSSSSLPLPMYVRGSGLVRCCTSSAIGSTPAVRASSRNSPSSCSASIDLGSTASTSPRSGSTPELESCRVVTGRIVPRLRLMTALADRLAARTLELVNIPSESRNEAEIAAHVRSLVPASFAPEYEAEDAFVWARPRRAGRPLVVLAGHYDTVPAQGNVPGASVDGAVVGLGASDMKGGLAVMLELARALEEQHVEPEVDLALLAFGKE